MIRAFALKGGLCPALARPPRSAIALLYDSAPARLPPDRVDFDLHLTLTNIGCATSEAAAVTFGP